MVDTKHVTDRRKLRFNSIADYRADLDRIEQADRAGQIRKTGNWTLGQILSHLAGFISYAYDGYPAELGKPPPIIRWILKFQRNRFINNRLPQGVKIPRTPEGTVGMRHVSTAEGLALLRPQLDRLESQAPSTPNIVFGPMTHQEWTNLHLRHGELHLGYVHPN